MGPFVPLAFTFFLGRTSTLEEEEQEQDDEEEDKVVTSLEYAEPSLPLDETHPDSAELESSSGFHSQSHWPSEASVRGTLTINRVRPHKKVLRFHHHRDSSCSLLLFRINNGTTEGACVHSLGTAWAQRAQHGHSAHITGRNWGFVLQWAILLLIQIIPYPHTVGQPDVSLFSYGTNRGGSVGPSSRTPGRAALVVAKFLHLAPRVSPQRKREAHVILRPDAFHARPWHLL